MDFEIDFIGVNEEGKNALATCFRFYSAKHQRYIVGVYDGGFKVHGEELVRLLNKYYFGDNSSPYIDFVVCSHSDNDHASGLAEIFDNFSVEYLIVNRPWLYANELYEYISDGRKTVNSLTQELKEKYKCIALLEEKAIEQGTQIHAGFQGLTIFDSIKVLSPSKQMFLDLIVESDKTPLIEDSASNNLLHKMFEAIKNTITELWGKDSLREDVKTTAENETSIVLYGDMENNKSFLFTGDAGLIALSTAADFADENCIDLHGVTFHQIPHHGGRHNVSSSVLNRIVGQIKSKNEKPSKTAFVSVAKGSDHPKKMVVNAYIRRGVRVYEARNSSKCHYNGTQKRQGYSTAEQLPFANEVESWD